MSEVSYSSDNDYYALFDVPPGATQDEIARAHKRLAKSCHPDLHPDKEWATERFKEINRAYKVLKDPALKGEYDRLRWAAAGKTGERPKPAGPVKRPKKRGGHVDAERHHKDRMMSYFIMGIEVLVLTMILGLVLWRALTKYKY